MYIFTRGEKGAAEKHRQKAPEKGSARRVVGGCGQSRESGEQGSPQLFLCGLGSSWEAVTLSGQGRGRAHTSLSSEKPQAQNP